MDPYDLSRVDETARRMLARYRTSTIAAEMAWYHTCDFDEGTRQRIYWTEVARRIRELSQTQTRA